MPPKILCCHGNVFTELLPSNDRVTHRQIHGQTNPRIFMKLICDRQSVGQFVWVSGLPLGPLTRFYLVLLFYADYYLISLPKASSLTRRRVCSLQWNHSLVPITILYCLI
jgi:hypothetical protein